MNSKEILANYVLGNVDESALIDVALQALAEGHDSPALRVLAGENPADFNAFEVRELLSRVLIQLNWSLPSPQEAARVLLCYWARNIIAGNVTPKDGAGHVTHEIYMYFRNQQKETYIGECLDVSGLISLYYAYDDLQEGFIEYQGKPLTKDEAGTVLDSEVLKEAHRYLQEHCA